MEDMDGWIVCEILLPTHRKKNFTPILYLQLVKRNVTPVSPTQAQVSPSQVSPSQVSPSQIFVKEDEVVRQETLDALSVME